MSYLLYVTLTADCKHSYVLLAVAKTENSIFTNMVFNFLK